MLSQGLEDLSDMVYVLFPTPVEDHDSIQDEMEFLDISSLSIAYRYFIKVKKKFK